MWKTGLRNLSRIKQKKNNKMFQVIEQKIVAMKDNNRDPMYAKLVTGINEQNRTHKFFKDVR